MLDKKKFLNKKTLTILISAIVILVALITIVATGAAHKLCEGCIGEDCTSCGGSGKIFSSIWALLPPVIAIGLALITKEVFSSLFIGILSGAISCTAGIFLFLIDLGVLVCLVNRAGCSRAF